MRVDVQDLLRTPYDAAHDCWWATRMAALRAWPDMDPRELPGNDDDVSALLESARGDGTEIPARWERVGDSAFAATRVGDVLFGVRANGEAHTACLVDDESKQAFTSREATGACLVRAFTFEGVLAVYRRTR